MIRGRVFPTRDAINNAFRQLPGLARCARYQFQSASYVETGKPTRINYEVRDGKKVRVAKSGKLIPEQQWTRTEKKETTDEQ